VPLRDLARNAGILIVPVNGTQTVIAIGDDHATVLSVAHEEEGRELPTRGDFTAILLYVFVTDSEKGEP